MCSSSYLPEEILFTIFLLLPVTSLIRLRAVCKLWLSIISNPAFIQTHLANSQKKQASVLTYGLNDRLVYIHTRNKFVSLYPPPQVMKILWNSTFISSCNGLVCLANKYAKLICLWNPSTKRFKILPTPNIMLNSNFTIDLMFCFDPISTDYKLLRLGDDANSNIRALRAELYSANANSWKEIQVPDMLKNFEWQSNVFRHHDIDGVLFLAGSEKMMLFDLHTEVFGALRYPGHERLASLLDFEGSVAMVCKSLNDETVLDLWKLDDVCGQGYWSKKFSFETNSKIDRVCLNLGGGQFVAYKSSVGLYIYYDNIKKETKKFNFPAFFYLTEAVKYTESLVSLKGFTGFRGKKRIVSGFRRKKR